MLKSIIPIIRFLGAMSLVILISTIFPPFGAFIFAFILVKYRAKMDDNESVNLLG